MDNRISEGVAPMSIEQSKKEIPLLAVKLVLGAISSWKYCGKGDVVGVTFDGATVPAYKKDFEIALSIAEEITRGWVSVGSRENCLTSPTNMLEMIALAQNLLAKRTDTREGKKGIIMLSDSDGCGFWRMRLPARYMKNNNWYTDITSGAVKYEHLLEYDTIFVQRFHEWDAFYVLEKLKTAGKRIVYDIDDDIFSIPRENPAANVIRKDQQFAAFQTMKLADVVTVSTITLRNRFEQDHELKGKVIVIPNALDLDGWVQVPLSGSQDGKKRIFWQGGSTHAEDWVVCIEAIEEVMKSDDRVVLTILGFLPPVVLDMVKRNGWNTRVEYMGFNEPETYYEMVKGVRADVGIAPLMKNRFNEAKSCLKFIENTLIGMPTVASAVVPYEEVIKHAMNGYLAETKQDWVACLQGLLGNDKERRNRMLTEARTIVAGRFNIREVALTWERVLCV